MKARLAHAVGMSAGAVASAALAQTPVAEMPFYLLPSVADRIAAMADAPAARGPGLEAALAMAELAFSTCAAKGETPSILVTDAAGVPVVLLSGGGAGERSGLVVYTTAATVVRYRTASREIFERVMTDARLRDEVRRDPKIGVARPGALPLKVGETLVGAIAIAGAQGGEACLQHAVAQTPIR